MTLVLDTGPLVAAADALDPAVDAVTRLIEAEHGLLIIPAPVTAEVDYLLMRRLGPVPARAFLADLAAGRFRVESLTASEHGVALALQDQYADLNLGLADLSVVVLAQRFNTRRLLTFDERHFRAIRPLTGGSFTLLPADEG